MLVPLYLKNWNPYKNNDFTHQNNDYQRIDLKIFLNVLTPQVLQDFCQLNWFNLDQSIKQFEDKIWQYPPVAIGDSFVEFKNFLIAAKLLFMTWFASEYWFWAKWWLNKFWNNKFYTHHWIDLILPKWTPIESFSDWEVIFAGWRKGWGNVVIVVNKDLSDDSFRWLSDDNLSSDYLLRKSSDNPLSISSDYRLKTSSDKSLYLIYAHLDEIKVSSWQKVKRWDIIWTCGNTWNARGYHLHFQIDTEKAPFHPYWNSLDSWFSEGDKKKYFTDVLQYCIDPWEWLREQELWRKFEEEQLKNIWRKSEENYTTNHRQSSEIITDNNSFKGKWKQNDINLNSDTHDKDFDILNEFLSFAKANANKIEDKPETADTKNEEQAQEQDLLNQILDEVKNNSSDIDDEILKLVNLWIVHWDENGDLLLDKPLTKLEFAVILYRLFMKIRKFKENEWMSDNNQMIRWLSDGFKEEPLKKINEKFVDINWNIISDEGKKAIKFVVSNWFMKGDWNRFYPWKSLTLVEFLAVIGRIFWNIKDWKDEWYKPYIDWAKENDIFDFTSEDLFKPVKREKVFKVLWKLIGTSFL